MASKGMHPLKAYREKQTPPLSQGDLAASIGVTRSAVCRWESGARQIDVDILPRVAAATGLPPAQLRPDLAALLAGA